MNFDSVVLGLDETTRELNEAWGLVTASRLPVQLPRPA